MNYKILLASASPRRSYLLDMLDVTFRVASSNVEEIIPPDMSGNEAPAYLAKLKGEACMHLLESDEILLAADTVVIHRNKILGKPASHYEARNILMQLSDEIHQVITGVYLSDGVKTISSSVATTVQVDRLSEDEIMYYIENYEVLDKAGAYGIQDWIGWAKIKSITGSYSNIMGLPTNKVYQLLSNFSKA